MLRAGVFAALVFGLALASPALSANSQRLASYCSRSGDVCYGVYRQYDSYQLRLTTAARYFNRYTICSKPPTEAATCKRFSVRRRGKNFGGVVLWQLNFPHKTAGKYRVTWKLGSHLLGPVLRFTYVPILVA